MRADRGGRADGEDSFVRNNRAVDRGAERGGADRGGSSFGTRGSSGRGGFFKNSGRDAAKKEGL